MPGVGQGWGRVGVERSRQMYAHIFIKSPSAYRKDVIVVIQKKCNASLKEGVEYLYILVKFAVLHVLHVFNNFVLCGEFN